jgi:hypothetical protein
MQHQLAWTLEPDKEKDYQLHQERNVRSREEKQPNEELSKTDKTRVCVTFDLEAVLPTPCSLVSQAY